MRPILSFIGKAIVWIIFTLMPLIAFWASNTLFSTQFEYGFYNWFAFWMLLLIALTVSKMLSDIQG